LNNRDQSWHLLQALRGHCDVDLVPGEDSLVLEIVEATGSDHGAVLRRLSSWQREFGVDSILIELDGREYVMSKTRPRQTLVSAG
jgi:hypothetical protein